MLKISVTMCALILLANCASTTIPAGATEREICRQWGDSLPTRSHADTTQTKAEIQNGYAVFALSCPDFADLVP